MTLLALTLRLLSSLYVVFWPVGCLFTICGNVNKGGVSLSDGKTMRRQHVLGQHEGQRHALGQRHMGDGLLQLGQQHGGQARQLGQHGGVQEHGGKLGHGQQQRVVQHGG